jgi:uncharacterized coiled-coil DUF342 family protein
LSREQKNGMINELEEKLAALREKKTVAEEQARTFAEKRDKINDKVRNIRTEIGQLRKERDEVNEKVKELKQHRNDLTSKIREKIEEIKKLGEKSRVIAKKKPSVDHRTLQEEVEDIDWEIQTTPHSLQEDKELVEKVMSLERQLSVHKKYERLAKMISNLRSEIDKFKAESQGYHESLTADARKSQELHGKMMTKVEESKKLGAEADELHKQFVIARETARPLHNEIAAVFGEIKKLKGEMREEEEKEKKQSEEELRLSIENRAKEKLKRGEKLSWEEFQLLAEKGISTQD